MAVLEEWEPKIRMMQENTGEVHLVMNTNNQDQSSTYSAPVPRITPLMPHLAMKSRSRPAREGLCTPKPVQRDYI